jgi:hypothetical protein
MIRATACATTARCLLVRTDRRGWGQLCIMLCISAKPPNGVVRRARGCAALCSQVFGKSSIPLQIYRTPTSMWRILSVPAAQPVAQPKAYQQMYDKRTEKIETRF